MFEDLSGFLYVFRAEAEISSDSMKHSDSVGTILIPSSMPAWTEKCLFDGSLQCSEDCLNDAGCKSIQLRQERK